MKLPRASRGHERRPAQEVLESAGTGAKVKGRVRLTECVHREVIAMCGGGGHWAKELPIASQPGKGICFEWLMPLTFEHLDTVSFTQDLCVKVKVAALESKPQGLDRPWES